MDSPSQSIDILLVEDSPTDADLTIRALREGSMQNEIHHVRDGVEAIEFLRKQGGFGGSPRPDLILLDLNLPKFDGRDVLREIRGDAELKTIPVIVLTTSSEERDVLESYGLHSNAYIVKPVDLDRFFQAVKSIDHFWFDVATLPPR